jgi:hypothetical protein
MNQLLSIVLLFNSILVAQEKKPTIDSFSWLSGCWEGTYSNGRTVSEHWMKPMGKMMLGTARTVKSGITVEYEFVRLVESNEGTIQYMAHPSGQKEAVFTLVFADSHRAVFENREHDFPQRIIYGLISHDSLFARIEGTINGKQRSSEYPYRRVTCE